MPRGKRKTTEPVLERRCDGCAHYHKSDDTQGVCRRYPPSVPAVNYAQFPPVRAEWNCGEFSGALK